MSIKKEINQKKTNEFLRQEKFFTAFIIIYAAFLLANHLWFHIWFVSAWTNPLIILFDVLLVAYILVLFFFKKEENKILKIWKNVNKRTLAVGISIIMLLLSLPILTDHADSITEVFTAHTWLEIASGLVIYALVEFKIEEYGKIPIADGERNYKEIIQGIGNSNRTIYILDNDFSSFFTPSRKKSLMDTERAELNTKHREYLQKKMKDCLINLEKDQKIKILLLHPNTAAAKQRQEDLPDEIDLFERMNDGFRFLYEFIEQLGDETDDERKEKLASKIEVRLFKTSYSIIFAAWDKNTNFTILPPEDSTDKETFKTLDNTPLAEYFKDNFEKIWTHSKTVELGSYLRLELKADEVVHDDLKRIHWGYDNYNHDLPVFICVEYKLELDDLKNARTVQIIHDGEVKWANVYEITATEKTADSGQIGTLYEYAIEQIIKKSGKPTYYKSNNSMMHVYELKYAHRHRIMLFEEDYVSRHLRDRGYCYTPHNKYELFLGTHMREMLETLYGFFEQDNFDQNITVDKEKDIAYRRILVGYTCEICNEKVTITNENDVVYVDMKDKLSCLNFNRDEQKKEIYASSMDKFLHTTIDADIRRILAGKTGLANKKYKVVVLLTQARVNPKSKFVDGKTFSDAYSERENKAKYIVLHSAGKKYISGGMPQIFIDENDQPSSRPTRVYNLLTSLDSVFIDNSHKDKKIRLESSKIIFNDQEYERKNKGEQKETACGYRNIVVVEFYED